MVSTRPDRRNCPSAQSALNAELGIFPHSIPIATCGAHHDSAVSRLLDISTDTDGDSHGVESSHEVLKRESKGLR
jgi:hypothetical protein